MPAIDFRELLRKGVIKLNRPLDHDFYDEQGTLLLCKGYQIDSEAQLEELVNRGAQTESRQEGLNSQVGFTPRSSFEAWETLQVQLHELLKRPPLDGSFPTKIRLLAEHIKSATLRSSNAAIAFMMLCDHVSYPISHSLHVAFLVNLLTLRLSWNEEDRTIAVCAALTMNIAMIRLQGELCHTFRNPDETQKHSIEIHPKVGVALLQRLGVTDPNWLQAVLEHHEVPGGEGYPNKIENPCQQAQIIRTCDIFSAKISPRATRKPMDAAQAAKDLFINEGIEARNPFSALLIKEIGIYPPGCIVRLQNSEIAIVTRRGNHAHSPIVQVLKNSAGNPVTDTIVRDTSRREFTVQASMLREDFPIPIPAQKIWP